MAAEKTEGEESLDVETEGGREVVVTMVDHHVEALAAQEVVPDGQE